MHGWRVHVQQGLCSSDNVTRVHQLHRMRRASDPKLAHMFVVPDVSDPGNQRMYIAMFGGAVLASQEYFQSAGHAGSRVVYSSPLQTEKLLWLSPRFARENPLLLSVLQFLWHGIGPSGASSRLALSGC